MICQLQHLKYKDCSSRYGTTEILFSIPTFENSLDHSNYKSSHGTSHLKFLDLATTCAIDLCTMLIFLHVCFTAQQISSLSMMVDWLYSTPIPICSRHQMTELKGLIGIHKNNINNSHLQACQILLQDSRLFAYSHYILTLSITPALLSAVIAQCMLQLPPKIWQSLRPPCLLLCGLLLSNSQRHKDQRIMAQPQFHLIPMYTQSSQHAHSGRCSKGYGNNMIDMLQT
jgi:hypothetical protein